MTDLTQQLLETATLMNRVAAQAYPPVTNSNGDHIKHMADVRNEPEFARTATYGSMSVEATDGLIAALEWATSGTTPTAHHTELLCLKVQAMVMRERGRKTVVAA